MTVHRNYLQEALASDENAWAAGGATLEQVAELEVALHAELPPSYRSFLASAGSISIGDSTISGIIDGDPLSLDGGSVLGDTIRARREQMLPSHLLVIQPDGDAPYCLDLSATAVDGECAVVCFEASASITTRIAGSFDQWFSTFYLADVFPFAPTNARYIRFDMSQCAQGNDDFEACAIGEVAFDAAAVPEPATIALVGGGLAAMRLRRRRRARA